MHYLYLNQQAGTLSIESEKITEPFHHLLADSDDEAVAKNIAKAFIWGFKTARDNPKFEITSRISDFQ